MNDVEAREMEIFDWRKKVTEAETKLNQQENQLESVVSERNLYSKNLIEAHVRSSFILLLGKASEFVQDFSYKKVTQGVLQKVLR